MNSSEELVLLVLLLLDEHELSLTWCDRFLMFICRKECAKLSWSNWRHDGIEAMQCKRMMFAATWEPRIRALMSREMQKLVRMTTVFLPTSSLRFFGSIYTSDELHITVPQRWNAWQRLCASSKSNRLVRLGLSLLWNYTNQITCLLKARPVRRIEFMPQKCVFQGASKTESASSRWQGRGASWIGNCFDCTGQLSWFTSAENFRSRLSSSLQVALCLTLDHVSDCRFEIFMPPVWRSPHRAAAWHSSWFEDHPGQEFFLIRDLASECGSSVPRPVVTSLN